ncbi:lipoprotein LprG [Nocardioides albertanoniae]|uniref:Lipoprotein LprG n=1 Tax=Nocardioides albertanoniae TaxID=1175486 RepID=A0A543A9H8_9ACTN|nr:LppX_LprAFG lipoprotein [Nocardioides albertanoniae]TQL69116.1 lipoprotein LprG [Nocardioides albertanoniae]
MLTTLGRHLPRLAFALVALLAALLVMTSCGDEDPTKGRTPKQVLAAAQKTLDETSGINFSIASDNLPEGVTTLKKASGTLTRKPAFEGTLTVPVMGTEAQVDVVSVDNVVYAKLPFTTSFQKLDPADYGVPDPAGLIAPDSGISSLLASTQGLELGKSVRGGADNKEILSTYTGTLPDTAVKKVLPGAAGEFDVTYVVNDSDELTEATIKGHFSGEGEAAYSYTIDVSEYDVEKAIAKP